MLVVDTVAFADNFVADPIYSASILFFGSQSRAIDAAYCES